VQRGWYATGLLQPLWQSYPGKRDALARNVGTSPSVLSQINTGNRRIGNSLASRLADELGVSLAELGAPEEAATDDPRSQGVIDRLARLEAEVEAWKGMLLEALALLDLRADPEADQGSRVQRGAAAPTRAAARRKTAGTTG
jgi:transcriptional regulator with XRE-family HTH domain